MAEPESVKVLTERTFPIQGGPDIPWWVAEYLYEHAGRIWHGDQSLERLAERGGWGRAELAHMLTSGSPFNPVPRHSRRELQALPMPLLGLLEQVVPQAELDRLRAVGEELYEAARDGWHTEGCSCKRCARMSTALKSYREAVPE